MYTIALLRSRVPVRFVGVPVLLALALVVLRSVVTAVLLSVVRILAVSAREILRAYAVFASVAVACEVSVDRQFPQVVARVVGAQV